MDRLFPSIRRPAALALAVFVVLGLVACAGRDNSGDFGADRVTIDLALAPSPPPVGTTPLTLTLADPSGAPVDGATVEIEGTMTHAGMRSVNAEARGIGEGRYQVDDFNFTMGGDWLLIARVTLPDGNRAQRTFTVDGVGDGAAAPPATARG